MPNKKYLNAKISDVNSVVGVHLLAFPGFFLTRLGARFLNVMYRAFLAEKSSVFVVVKDKEIVQGFAVGTVRSGIKDRKLAFRFFMPFFFAIIPAVLRNPLMVTKRVVSRFMATGEQPDIPEGAAFLRSIGILSDARGSGIADGLLREFENQSRLRGAAMVALTTDAVDNERAIAFYKKNGYEVKCDYRQDKVRAMLLMTKTMD